MVRQGGQRAGRLTFKAFHDTALAHLLLAPLSTADQICTYMIGSTLGNPAFNVVSKQLNYDPKRGPSGELLIDVDQQSNAYGAEWGEQLTAGARTDTASTNGTGLDYGVAVGTTAFGLQLYVHLGALTGTSIAVKLQHSNDDGGADPYADITGATTGALTTAPQAVRVATSATASIKRYIRAVSTGVSLTTATFVAVVCRNLTATTF
jgi:hypothetical protein